ncbi:DUF4402 domain-containing protein [Flavobacterium sp. NG2]|uniref:DUF4402 domain-containing protein n=1 Tax=Flavobacterium sp. NG2 TaxID=3097547 RepID=UPI002A7EDBF9|nr:DUF4402 domain-containing protein [Flavobacterium sp. NG2]WPR71436.1 DUF4402 domain-containing protein [Flavobacterium sp. NG2]
MIQKQFNFNGTHIALKGAIVLLLLLNNLFVFSQPALPQRSITVAATQALHFGTFALTGAAGGTVTVGWNGSRTATGAIGLLNSSPTAQPAIFEIKLCQGRNVTITLDPTVTLSGSEGGSLILNLGPTEKGSSGAVFATDGNCNFVSLLRVGGTLNVPGAAIPGVYTGTFFITFNQE